MQPLSARSFSTDKLRGNAQWDLVIEHSREGAIRMPVIPACRSTFVRALRQAVFAKVVCIQTNSGRLWESPLQSLFCRDDLQIIGHRKDSGDAVGAKGDHVLVGFAVHDALQGHVTVLHDDADGLLYAERVFL